MIAVAVGAFEGRTQQGVNLVSEVMKPQGHLALYGHSLPCDVEVVFVSDTTVGSSSAVKTSTSDPSLSASLARGE